VCDCSDVHENRLQASAPRMFVCGSSGFGLHVAHLLREIGHSDQAIFIF
jgi:hypothetical protein